MTDTGISFERQDWISLDSLCLLCRSNDLAISFGSRTKRDWISPFGVAAHPETLDVAGRLSRCLNFEVVPMSQGSGVRYFVTREELEQQLKRILN